MALERAFVFRQLDSGSRYSRFGIEDVVPAVVPTILAAPVCLLLELHPLYTVALFGALIGTMWLIRTRVDDPIMDLLFYAFEPKHFSPMASDTDLEPYPAAPPQRAETGGTLRSGARAKA